MIRALAISCIFVSVALSGCLGRDGGDETEETGAATTTADGGGNVTSFVTLDFYPDTATVGEPINITWSVDPGNETDVNITHTAVHWANFRVSDPSSPADYGNTSGERLATAPGTFETSFTVNESAGTLYVRAHALIEGQNHWSDEVEISLEGIAKGEVHAVEIRGIAGLAAYDPDEITLKLGDGVTWTNMDSASSTHTASSDDDAPESFDTGDIAAGSTTDPVFFETAGTYNYHCNRHPTTMHATIIVEE